MALTGHGGHRICLVEPLDSRSASSSQVLEKLCGDPAHLHYVGTQEVTKDSEV
jgi:hypothetical protein